MKLDLIDSSYIFPKILDFKLESKSHEYRALAVIRYLFPDEPFLSLVKFESPDFISCDKSIGLEVTDVVIDKHMQIEKTYIKYKHPENDIKKQKNGELIHNSGARLLCSRNNQIEYLEYDTYTVDLYVRAIKQQISSKVEKSEKYEQVSELDLALLFCDPIDEDFESYLRRNIDILIGKSTKFMKIFIVSSSFCIKYDVKDHTVVKKDLTKDEDIKLKILGRLTAEGTLSLKSPEWID